MSGLFQVRFFEDEVLTSYISRMARANGRSSSLKFCEEIGLDVRKIHGGDEDELRKLSNLFRKDINEISYKAVKRGPNDTRQVFGASFHRRMLERTGLRFCPKCFEADELDKTRMPGTRRYQRLAWMMSDIAACAVHNCRLLEIGGPSEASRFDFCSTIEPVLAELSTWSQRAVAQPATPFEIFVYDRTRGQLGQGSLLDEMSLSAAMELSLLLGVALNHGKRHGVASLGEVARLSAASTGLSVLLEGETAFRSALDKLVGTDRDIHRLAGGPALYGNLYLSIDRRDGSRDFDRVKEIIRDHALDIAPLVPGAALFGALDNTEWASIPQASRASGVSEEKIVRYLRSFEAEGTRLSGPVARADAVKDAVSFFENAVRTEKAAAILGCGLETFRKSFQKTGLVRPMKGTEIGPATKALYAKTDLLQLRAKLLKNAPRRKLEGLVSIRAAAKSTRMSVGVLAQLIADGKLKHVGQAASGDLEDRLHVSLSELLELNADTNLLGRAEVVAQLMVPDGTLKRLRALGLFASSAKLRGRDAYDIKEVRAFNKQFASITLLASEYNAKPHSLSRRVALRNIPHAFPGQDVGCLIVRRRDVPRLLEP